MRLSALTAVLALFPVIGSAQMMDSAASAPGDGPALGFTLRGGVASLPGYFGADTALVTPDLTVSFYYSRLFGFESGNPDPDAVVTGFDLGASFRVIPARTAALYPELTGLTDLDAAIEIGAAVTYTQPMYELYGTLRSGVIGHDALAGEVGVDFLLSPGDRLSMRLGPSLSLGDDSFAGSYFGVTGAEAAASGLPAFAAGGGVLGAGVGLVANYDLGGDWGIEGAVAYQRLLNDAADSPITLQGSEDQFSARIGVTRVFSFGF